MDNPPVRLRGPSVCTERAPNKGGVKWLGGRRILSCRKKLNAGIRAAYPAGDANRGAALPVRTLYFVVNKERVRNRYGSLSRCRPQN